MTLCVSQFPENFSQFPETVSLFPKNVYRFLKNIFSFFYGNQVTFWETRKPFLGNLGNMETFFGNRDTFPETGSPIELLIPVIIKVFINIRKPGHNFEKLGYIFRKPRYISRRLASSDPYL